MSVLPILRWPDPCLAQVCARAEITDELRALAADMFDTIYAAPGRGLAAPQVGRPIRLFVMDCGWKDGTPDPTVMVNPERVAASDAVETRDEGCLSIPGVTARVTRPAEVTMRWTDLDGASCERRLGGFAATCAQHELDHLDGIVTFDRVDPATRATLKAAYMAA